MPIYDFKCSFCGNVFEALAKVDENVIVCKFCENFSARKIFSGTRFYPFKPYWETNLDDKPIYIENKKQLRQECNKRGLDYI